MGQTCSEQFLQKTLNPVGLKSGSLKQSMHSICARVPHTMHCWGPEKYTVCCIHCVKLLQSLWVCMPNQTFREEVSDIQLQRGNDFVKHLEFLPKARHLEDEAGRHLE